MKTDYHVDDQVTVSDCQSEHYRLTGTIARVHSIKGQIFYDVCLPHRSGIGGDSKLLRSNQLSADTTVRSSAGGWDPRTRARFRF